MSSSGRAQNIMGCLNKTIVAVKAFETITYKLSRIDVSTAWFPIVLFIFPNPKQV